MSRISDLEFYSELPHLIPAFPSRDQDGMSLRDWFAGMALQAGATVGMYPEGVQRYAEAAYALADAMLAARGQS